MSGAPYALDEDDRPRLGLIVLQADETIEDEFRHAFDPAQVRMHVSRVPSGAELSPETIMAMARALPAAAALFPEGARFDAVGYACTSGSALIGSERVADLVRSACDCDAVTNPLEAGFAALGALKARRIGILSPYTDAIAQKLAGDFEAAGFEVAATLSFGEAREAAVARIATASVVEAVERLSAGHDLEAVFLSCTNLRTRAAIAALKARVAVPVISSNSALAWHMARLARLPGVG